MSYKVLYRKYRPTNFREIIGQKSITDNLKSSILNDTFSHAYIFTGPRGTGKTSTAKVLAKAINCLDLQDGEICGKCEACKNFSTSPDIIEIDAASNNGVDEIRELRANITHAPASSKYKIYIIDEVHMLSTGAFNALLKTLEEPPEHAIFILATTEVYKVPITILSRCQRYDFKKIDKKELIEYLKEICKKEKIDYEDQAIEEIYSLSEGCLRDALSVLDQISKNGDKLTLESILEGYNIISTNDIDTLLKLTVQKDVTNVIEMLERFENNGMNAQKLLKKIIHYLENCAIMAKTKKKVDYSFDFVKKLIVSLNECYIDARVNENTFTMIKLAFLEMIDNPSPKSPLIETKETTTKKESEVEIKVSTKNQKNNPLDLTNIRINNCFAEANKNSLNELIKLWQESDKLKLSGLAVTDYKPVAASENYAIFTTEENSLADLFNIKKETVEKQLKKSKKTIKVIAISDEKWKIEKERYIKMIKSGGTYDLIEEPQEIDDSSKLKGQLGDLFIDKIVEIS